MGRLRLLTATVVFLVGGCGIFGSRQWSGRLLGAAAVAVSASSMLAVAAASLAGATGLLAVTAATLAGLLVFAWWLERRAMPTDDAGLALDEDPLR